MNSSEDYRVKQRTIFYISFAISAFIHLRRALTLFFPDNVENATFTQTSLGEIGFRIITVFVLNYLILYFHLRWKPLHISQTPSVGIRFKIFLINISITVLMFLLFFFLYPVVFKTTFIANELYSLMFGFIIILLTNLLTVMVLELQVKNKITIIEKERLIQEKISNELNALKSQVNPHFLFNSLNTLNGIIRKTPEKATLFVDELSFMYRYILQSGSKGLVKVEEELKFLNSYIYLVNQRFGKNINFNIELNPETKAAFIPVLALQIVVENAIKHNEVSNQNPLIISIQCTEKKEIVISNIIALRTHVRESTGNGLSNLSQRYHLLLNKDIRIKKNHTFTVHLPISLTNLEL